MIEITGGVLIWLEEESVQEVQAPVPDHPGPTSAVLPPTRTPVHPAATARPHPSPAPFHRPPAARSHRSPAATGQVDDGVAAGVEVRDVGAFVLGAANAHRFEAGVGGEGDAEGAGVALAFELGAVVAGEVMGDGGGREWSAFLVDHGAGESLWKCLPRKSLR
ncbi:MAG: hypothetical protein ACK52I_01255 [Pseudomonadota bacterium]